MKHPMDSDFTVTRKGGGMHVLFAPTKTHHSFRFLADAEDIARFGPLSPDGHFRHAKTGDTAPYLEGEVLSAARRLATEAANGDRILG